MRRDICAYLVLVLFSLNLSLPSAQAATGRTAGSFTVSSTGASTYTVPIYVPPGPHGLQPTLAVSYNSQSSDDIMGPGWHLNGLSSITRCGGTFSQDGNPSAVTATYADYFCLDGQRLRLTSSDTLSTYGQDSTTYQTEATDYRNVIAHGTTGYGPTYFSVKDSNGTTYEYGNTTDSRVVPTGLTSAIQWLLDKVTDGAGNTYIVSYSQSNGVAVPSTISYTPQAAGSSSYTYEVNFAYTADLQRGIKNKYVAGAAIKNNNILTSITVQYLASTIKKYVFSYSAAPVTSRYRLSSIQECADDGQTNCLLATSINYQDNAAGVSNNSTTAVSSSANSASFQNWYDVDGDGRTDLIWYSGTWYVSFAQPGGGYGTPKSTGITTTKVAIGDVGGTGKVGFLVDAGTSWYYYTWNGTSFVQSPSSVAPADSTVNQAALVDTNGDGLPDLVTTDSGSGYVYIRLNTSSGSGVSFSATQNIACSCAAGWTTFALNPGGGVTSGMHSLDFNGDGHQDLFVEAYNVNTYQEAYYLLLAGSTGITFNEVSFPFFPAGFINFNNDRCTDVVASYSIYVSKCNGSNWTVVPIGSGSLLPIAEMDWDGDGRTDILVNNGGTVGVYESTGDISAPFSSLIATNIQVPNVAGTAFFGFDADGDGLQDLGLLSGTSPYPVTYYLHNGADAAPDLVTSITDGFQNSVSINYAPITQANVAYTGSWGDLVYPNAPSMAPLYVTWKATFSDPSANGSTYYQQWWYADAGTNLQGRGFLGFGAQQRYDSRSGIWETWDFSRNFPYSGMVTTDLQTLNNSASQQILSTVSTPAQIVLDSTNNNQRYFVYDSAVTTVQNEVGGARSGAAVRTTNTTSQYDNWGNSLNAVQTITDTDTSSPYYNQQWVTTTQNTYSPDAGTNWCLHLPTQIVVTKTAPNLPPNTNTAVTNRTRTVSFVSNGVDGNDYAHCWPTEKVTEPNNSTYQVTESVGHDSFGNVNSDTVTGATGSPATRTTSSNWGTTGQFPVTSSNALGATESRVFDFVWGRLISDTDPNGLQTTWTLDPSFGRITKELRPDQTYSLLTYSDCASTGNCLIGTHGLISQITQYGSDSNVVTSATTYYDSIDRPLVTSKLLLDGTYDRNEVRYDSLGRLSQTSMPCAFSSIATTCSYWETDSYDSLNRVTETQRPTSATNNTPLYTQIFYAGDTVTTQDPKTVQTSKIYTPVGELGETIDANNYQVTRGYDGFGSLLSAVDSNGNTLQTATYDYGLDAYMRSSADIDAGPRSAVYDAFGEITKWTNGYGTTTQSYDALGRPTGRVEPAVSGVSAELDTTWVWGTTAAAHDIGRLDSVTAGAKRQFTYDNYGRVSQEDFQIPADTTYTFNYTYSANGLLSSLEYPASYPATYRFTMAYNYTNGVLSSLTQAGSPQNVYYTATGNDADGHVTQFAYGGAAITKSFDAVTGLLNSVQAVNGSTSLQNESYLYDEVGNLKLRQNNTLLLNENFYYDSDYRLDHSTLNGTTNLQMAYDNLGNITSRSDFQNGATWSYSPTHVHQVLTQGSNVTAYYKYDGDGNVTNRFGYAIGWSSYDMPVSIAAPGETTTISYGPNHARYEQVYTNTTAGTETTFYVDGLFEKAVNGSTIDYRMYAYANGSPVWIGHRTVTGTTLTNPDYFALTNNQGSLSAIVKSGSVYEGESFTAFGSRRSASTWSGAPLKSDTNAMNGVTRQGYAFQTMLGISGMIHMNGRVMDSLTGRFLSPDPVVQDPTNTQAYNAYSYVYNNPATFTDPSGYDCQGTADSGDSWTDIQKCLTPPPPAPPARNTNPLGLPWWVADNPQATVYFANGLIYDGGMPGGNGIVGYDLDLRSSNVTVDYAYQSGETVRADTAPVEDLYAIEDNGAGGIYHDLVGVFHDRTGTWWWAPGFGTSQQIAGYIFDNYASYGAQMARSALGDLNFASDTVNVAGLIGSLVIPGLDAAEAGKGANIALGLRAGKLREFASDIGANHLLDDPNWKQTLTKLIADPSTTFHISLNGFFGDGTAEMITNEMSAGTYTGWELQQLQNAGRLAGSKLYLNGVAVPNPF